VVEQVALGVKAGDVVDGGEGGCGQLVEPQGRPSGCSFGVLLGVSLGPIIVIAIAIARLFFGNDAVTSQVTSSLKDMLGDTGAKAVESMLAGASRPAEGVLATILGVGALLFAAIGVVVQLKDALNVV
jgi:uncharacterized BrkB/YihY/UPF0761 family membrane protein